MLATRINVDATLSFEVFSTVAHGYGSRTRISNGMLSGNLSGSSHAPALLREATKYKLLDWSRTELWKARDHMYTPR